ncbi:hypothetical protein [Botrimarina sp.]|uniref:hypothetical protein n=1 Tax=Botrimarina sp. TaxID=2795802 RepID=UPI0032EC5CF9
MFQAIDHRFAQPIQRGDGVTIKIDFSAKWDTRPLHNEGSRFVLSLNHDYPSGGLDLTPEGHPAARVGDFAFNNGAAWARPAYSLRLRTLNKESLLAFGGGPDIDGNYEATEATWLPGFIQSPGGPNNPAGGSPEVGVPGVVGAGLGRYSQEEFLDYRYVIAPLEQQLWIDLDGDGEFDELNETGVSELVGSQPIATPTIELGGTDYTRAFNTIEGIRLFWRGRAGSAQAIVDSLRVIVDGLDEQLAGDFNHDGYVDAADYTVWRDTLGSTADLAADGDGSGRIDQNDYVVWQQNFGATSARPRSVAIPSVPEPASTTAPGLAAIFLVAVRDNRGWRGYPWRPSEPGIKARSG